MPSFFRSPPSDSCSKENGLAAFGALHELGRTWAESGSQLILMSADSPSIANIQTCEVLCLYWFALGLMDRTAIHYSKMSYYADLPSNLLLVSGGLHAQN